MLGRTNACSSGGGGTLKAVVLSAALVIIPEILQEGDVAVITLVQTNEPPDTTILVFPTSVAKTSSDGTATLTAMGTVSELNNSVQGGIVRFEAQEAGGATVLTINKVPVVGADRAFPDSTWAKGYYTIVKAPTE